MKRRGWGENEGRGGNVGGRVKPNYKLNRLNRKVFCSYRERSKANVLQW